MRYLVVISLALLGAVLGAGGYMLRLNPEVAMARKVVAAQQRQLAATAGERQVIFVGGSSCSFSIDPVLLREEFGLAVCNLGLPAGTGRGLHLERALQETGKGDLLVVAFEMTGWTGEEGDLIAPLGSQIWYGGLRSVYDGKSKLGEIGLRDRYELTEVRPGGQHCMTMGAKLVAGQPLFRYGAETVRMGGYMRSTETDWPVVPRGGVTPYRLSPQMGGILKALVGEMRGRGAEVVVSLPWCFTKETVAEEQREANRVLLAELAAICPVLEDGRCGVETEREFFADTVWHLTGKGAAERSRVVGRSLAAWAAGETSEGTR